MKKKAPIRQITALLLGTLLLSSCGSGVTEEQERQIVSAKAGNSASYAVISAYRASPAAQAQVTDTSADADYYPAVSYSDFDLDESAEGAVKIALNGTGADFASDAVTLGDGVLTIGAAGSYLLTGDFAGQIRVEAAREDNVHLVFAGLTVECAMAPLCAVSAKNVSVTLAPGTENTLTDGADYTFAEGEDEPDAAMYSKTDLTINGSGALTVNGNYKNGIVSKDDLIILGGTITVNAVYNGIKGKDSLTVGGGILNVTAGNDGIKSSNDEDSGRGWVVIGDGEISIRAGDDAVHAETWLIITGGTVRVAESCEGLEGRRVEIYGGDIEVVSSDDAVNAASGSAAGDDFGRGGGKQDGGDFGGKNGGFGGRSGEDGEAGGQNDWASGMNPGMGRGGNRDGRGDMTGGADGGMPEGFDGEMPEGMAPPDGFGGEMPGDPGGEDPFAREDAQSGFGRGGKGGGMMGGMGMMNEEPEEGVYILMAGGTLRAQGGNDIIDSNGTFEQTGGVIVTAGPSMTVYGEPDGVIDTNGTMALTGGTFVSFCRNVGSALTSAVSLPGVTVSLNGAETVTLTDGAGEVLLSAANDTKASSVLLISDGMTAGVEYVLDLDGSAYPFTAENGVQSLR